MDFSNMDAAILACIRRDWSKTAMVIARVLHITGEDGEAAVERVAARIRELVASGRIEVAGDLKVYRESEIRLVPKAATSE